MPFKNPEDKARYMKAYNARPDQRKKRSMRVMARRKLAKEGKVKKGDGKDVNHKTPLDKGGNNARSNLSVMPEAKNRGFKRDSRGQPKS